MRRSRQFNAGINEWDIGAAISTVGVRAPGDGAVRLNLLGHTVIDNAIRLITIQCGAGRVIDDQINYTWRARRIDADVITGTNLAGVIVVDLSCQSSGDRFQSIAGTGGNRVITVTQTDRPNITLRNGAIQLQFERCVIGGIILGRSCAIERTRGGIKHGRSDVEPVAIRRTVTTALDAGVWHQKIDATAWIIGVADLRIVESEPVFITINVLVTVKCLAGLILGYGLRSKDKAAHRMLSNGDLQLIIDAGWRSAVVPVGDLQVVHTGRVEAVGQVIIPV